MKDGDLLLEKLRQAAARRNKLAVIVFTANYNPPYWYWLDWLKCNSN